MRPLDSLHLETPHASLTPAPSTGAHKHKHKHSHCSPTATGPKEQLDNTVYSQPALFVAGLAAVERLRAQDPAAVARCGAAAGLSLGEYTALVFAGAMSFEDGLKVGGRGAGGLAGAEASQWHGALVAAQSGGGLCLSCCERRM